MLFWKKTLEPRPNVASLSPQTPKPPNCHGQTLTPPSLSFFPPHTLLTPHTLTHNIHSLTYYTLVCIKTPIPSLSFLSNLSLVSQICYSGSPRPSKQRPETCLKRNIRPSRYRAPYISLTLFRSQRRHLSTPPLVGQDVFDQTGTGSCSTVTIMHPSCLTIPRPHHLQLARSKVSFSIPAYYVE